MALQKRSGARQVAVPTPTPNPRREPAPAATNEVQQAESEGEAGYLEQVDRTPVFEGYEDDRYQQHDERIERLVSAFNEDKASFIGAEAGQVEGISDLDPALVKSWLIQETGGGDRRSRAAWDKDPAQVNVPGDWSKEKADGQMGLKKPRRRNEGDADTNLKAAITWLTRKGFSRSGKAPEKLTGGQTWSGWETALENYNGRGERRRNGKRYRENYADRIEERAEDPQDHAKIQLP